MENTIDSPEDFARRLVPNNYSVSQTNLEQLIKVLFQVSLKKEEGRFPNFFVWVPNKDSQMPVLSMQFSQPIEVTVESLHRIFPAIPSRPYALVIEPEIESLRILGIARIEYSGFSFVVNQGYIFERSTSIPGLVLGIEGPATLSAVHYSTIPPHSEIQDFELREGKIVNIKSHVSGSISSVICTRISEVLKRKEANNGVDLRPLVNGSWSKMLTIATELRHGGMFIVIPSDISESQLNNNIRIGHKTDEPKIGNSILDIQGSPVEKMQTYIDIWDSKIKLAANISAVDGAVLLDWNYNVLSFKNEIVIKDNIDLPDCHRLLGYTPGDKIDISNFGTRHRSAARLCANLKEVFVVVISQDGEIREFMPFPDGKVGICGPLRQVVGLTCHP